MKWLREARSASASMTRLLVAVLLVSLVSTAEAKASSLSAEQLDGFLKKLHRSVQHTLEIEKQHHDERQAICKQSLAFLQSEGKRAEGVMEELRHEIKEMKEKETVSLLQQQGQEASELNRTDGSASHSLGVSVKARLSDAEQRLQLRGVSSSATHRFANAMRKSCEAGGQFLDGELKALELQDSSLGQAIEALHAAEALHGLDQSTLSAAAVELQSQVSFLQMATSAQAEMPDLLSFFRSKPEASEDGADEPSLLEVPFTKPVQKEPQAELLQAMPEQQRPDVFGLVSKMQVDGRKDRSKQEAWCAEELGREKQALKEARASAELFGNDAAANARLQGNLDEELGQMQRNSAQVKQAAKHMLEDATNWTKGMDSTSRDQVVAAKVLKTAAQGLSALREQWWGHSTSNPVESAMRALTSAGTSFEQQALSSKVWRSESSESATLVSKQAKDLLTALAGESSKLELLRDFYAERQQRSEENKELYAGQAKSSESSLRSLEDACSKKKLDLQESGLTAEMNALHDAQMVFLGHHIKAKSLRGAGLSPMEKAALEMGVSMDD